MSIKQRVGAIYKSDQDKVWLFGYGVYEGNEIPPPDPEGKRGMMQIIHEAKMPNPKILLDSGQFVWGCECWWAPELEVRKRIGDREVIMVKPGDVS